MKFLFPDSYEGEREMAAAILSSDDPQEGKFGAFFGEGGVLCIHKKLNLSRMTSFEDIREIVAAIMVSNPSGVQFFLELRRFLKNEQTPSGVFLRGCILGLLSGVCELERLKVEFSEEFRSHFFCELFDLMWRWGEDNGFIDRESACLSDFIAALVAESSICRSADFRRFLSRITLEADSNKGYPSPLAEQVSSEFLHKVTTRVSAQAGKALSKALEEIDTFYA